MVYNVISIYDEVDHKFVNPTFEVSDISAIRNFGSSCKSAQAKEVGLLWSNPTDFTLWRIGTFDSESGHLESCKPERLAIGSDFLD